MNINCPFCQSNYFQSDNAIYAISYGEGQLVNCSSCRAYLDIDVNNKLIYSQKYFQSNSLVIYVDFLEEIVGLHLLGNNESKKQKTFHNSEELQKVIKTFLMFL